ncbi:PPE-repeat proteins [Mycobacterium basiliense]|uniref:PPE-repeat proteins n=1 Tax=Mycobacterium basiliense TaxID=2094119 RepID=A0A447GCI1_9MYCO|nr:PE domain-containing protein [Mycobacterium basiliense]VDM88210.1 PPE-repeat proteins [Mycobacterium basiliense]
MSFLTTQPEELAAAAGKLEAIGAVMNAENVAAAVPITTGVIPAAADEVSALQASLFAAYGTLYQEISAEAATMYDLLVNTLGASAGTYAATEEANSSAAASPLSGIIDALTASTPASDIANLVNIGIGNWASASSDLLALAGGGLLPAAVQAAEGDVAEAAGSAEAAASAAGAAALGEAPMAAGLGSASAIATASVSPSWAGQASLVSTSVGSGALRGAGWTVPVAQEVSGTIIPGMPGLASAARSSAGFGAPRYGVKPIVMPKPAAG